MGALPTYLTKGNASGDQWRGALCRQHDPDIFHVDEEETKWYMTAEAKKVCGDCPIKGPCLDYALANKELSGIWGGTTGAERKELRDKEAQDPASKRKERGLMPRYEDDYRRAYHRAYQESVAQRLGYHLQEGYASDHGAVIVWHEHFEPGPYLEDYLKLMKPNLNIWDHLFVAVFLGGLVMGYSRPEDHPVHGLFVLLTLMVAVGTLLFRGLHWLASR